MGMTTARQRVLNYLRKRRTVSAADISRDLGMTQANARHHLAILEETGLVEVVGRRQGGRRGRPVKLYGLGRVVLGDGLDVLASRLLDEWLDSVSDAEKASRLQKLARRFAGDAQCEASASPMRRLTATVARLNELGYQARWEAHADGPRVILGLCPYAAIIAKHPELCQMDAALLTDCLARRVTQLAKLEGEEGGRPHCVFGERH